MTGKYTFHNPSPSVDRIHITPQCHISKFRSTYTGDESTSANQNMKQIICASILSVHIPHLFQNNHQHPLHFRSNAFDMTLQLFRNIFPVVCFEMCTVYRPGKPMFSGDKFLHCDRHVVPNLTCCITCFNIFLRSCPPHISLIIHYSLSLRKSFQLNRAPLRAETMNGFLNCIWLYLWSLNALHDQCHLCINFKFIQLVAYMIQYVPFNSPYLRTLYFLKFLQSFFSNVLVWFFDINNAPPLPM